MQWENGEGHPATLIPSFMKLAPGKTVDDVKAALQSQSGGPPPAEFVGGAGALAPGSSAWLKMSLEPDSYVAVSRSLLIDVSTDANIMPLKNWLSSVPSYVRKRT